MALSRRSEDATALIARSSLNWISFHHLKEFGLGQKLRGVHCEARTLPFPEGTGILRQIESYAATPATPGLTTLTSHLQACARAVTHAFAWWVDSSAAYLWCPQGKSSPGGRALKTELMTTAENADQ